MEDEDVSGLIESYDAAIASLEMEAAVHEGRANRYEDYARFERARAEQIRTSIQEMRKPRNELAKLYPPEPQEPKP